MDSVELESAAPPESGASMRAALAELRRLLDGGARRVRLHGADGSLLALVAAQLASDEKRVHPLVLVARDDAAATALHRDLQFFLPERVEGGKDDPARPPRVMLLPEL